MPPLVGLTMRDLQLAHMVLREVFATDPEPLPGWEQGDQRLLATCCSCTEAGIFGYQKYATLPAKAAKLFYSIIKSHPFPNGNKRFALVAVAVLLRRNGHHLSAEVGLPATIGKWVAESDPRTPEEEPDAIIYALILFFMDAIEPGPWRRPEADQTPSG